MFDILGLINTGLDKIFPDANQKEQREIAKQKASMLYQQGEFDYAQKKLETSASIITSESKGNSWMQRNWRPVLMFSFIAIIINNFILVPYLNAFGLLNVHLEIPPNMWTLLQWGVCGYIGGRTIEKATDNRKK